MNNEITGVILMYSKEAKVKSVIGLHARPATMLVKLAGTFKSKIMIRFQGKEIDASSLWDVLGAGIKGGTTVLVIGDGEDEEDAVDKVAELIESVEN